MVIFKRKFCVAIDKYNGFKVQINTYTVVVINNLTDTYNFNNEVKK